MRLPKGLEKQRLNARAKSVSYQVPTGPLKAANVISPCSISAYSVQGNRSGDTWSAPKELSYTDMADQEV